MNCECKMNLEKSLLDRFEKAQPEASGHAVELTGYAIGFDKTKNEMFLAGVMKYEATADYPLKKGGEKRKKAIGQMLFSFCPFCGVKV